MHVATPATTQVRNRAHRARHDRRERAQRHAAQPVLALVRRQRLGASRSPTARSCSASASRSGRRPSSASSGSWSRSSWSASSRSPASADPRRRWCSAARCSASTATGVVAVPLVDPHRRLGDGADRAARSSPSTRPCWPLGGPADSPVTKIIALIVVAGRSSWSPAIFGFKLIMRLQTGHHHRHRRRHGDLPDPGRCRTSTSARSRRLPAGIARRRHRRPRLHDDRLRARLGQRGRRLLALPAAHARAARGSSAGRRFGAALAPVVLLVFGLLLAGSSKKLARRDRRRTRSAR